MILLIARIHVTSSCALKYNNNYPLTVGVDVGLLYEAKDANQVFNYLMLWKPKFRTQQIDACPTGNSYSTVLLAETLTVDCPIGPTTPTFEPTLVPSTPTFEPTLVPSTPTFEPTLEPSRPSFEPTLAPSRPTPAPQTVIPTGQCQCEEFVNNPDTSIAIGPSILYACFNNANGEYFGVFDDYFDLSGFNYIVPYIAFSNSTYDT